MPFFCPSCSSTKMALGETSLPVPAVAGTQTRSVVDARGAIASFHVAFLPPDDGGLRIAATACNLVVADPDALALHDGAQRDELVLERQGEREEPLVLRIKGSRDRAQTFLFESLEIDVDREPEPLAVIPHVDLVPEFHLRPVDLLARKSACGGVGQ